MSFALAFRKAVRKLLFMRELPTLEQYHHIHRVAAHASKVLDADLGEMGQLNAELKKLEQSLPEVPENAKGGTGLGDRKQG